jgi:hypothetical protein
MAIRVTLHVFSGRPNPTWVLDSKQTTDLVALLQAAQSPSNVKPPGALGRLGYRGFSIEGTLPLDTGRLSEPLSLFIHEGIVDHGPTSPAYIEDQPALERHLLDSGVNALHPDVATHVESSITSPPLAFTAQMLNLAAAGCPVCTAADAPIYNPGAWNTPSVQPVNNCYNYANDHPTGTFAQPGRATGHPIPQGGISCGGVQPSAQSDGLIAAPNFAAPLVPGSGWYVALVVWPGNDYHWYRQDHSGCWSHKPGQTAVRNTDQNGASIADPRTAARGPYTAFCTYMITKRSVTIR